MTQGENSFLTMGEEENMAEIRKYRSKLGESYRWAGTLKKLSNIEVWQQERMESRSQRD